jgi:glycosyltransferase involved in cell wall biosynthesis
MRVLINAAGSNIGGAVTYLTNLLPQLARLQVDAGRDDHFIVVAPSETIDKLHATLEEKCFSVEHYREPPVQNLKRVVFDQIRIPRLIRQHAADLLFSANGFGTLRPGCPEALLIRNPIYFCPIYERKLRELGRSLRAIRLRRYMSLISIRSADLILFPTQAMLDLARPYGGLRSRDARVIHYGFNRETFFREGAGRPAIADAMREWRAEGKRVLLGVSAFAIHKNFDTLVEAMPELIERGCETRLVLTIAREQTGDVKDFDDLLRRIETLGLDDVVHLSGHVPYEQLQHLYAESDVFVFPSFAESFGHSMVEAMACGLPSVAADIPVNREVLAGSASYFESFDPKSCAAAISEVLCQTDLARTLRAAAELQARNFSWSAYAISLLDEFEQLLGGPR